MNRIMVLLLLLPGLVQAQRDSVSVYFPFNDHRLTMEARNTLDSFVAVYGKNEMASRLTLQGFCDTIGNHAYNDRLARQRVFSVHDHLLNSGIPKTAVRSITGYGKRRPVNSNSTEEERLRNRRVDIIYEMAIAEKPIDSTPPPPVKDTVLRLSKTTIDSVKEGDTLVLRNINFYGGRHRFLPTAYESLDELLELMKARPKLEIELQGHICCRYPSDSDGMDLDTGEPRLSYNRARAVAAFLVERGINRNRIRYRGFGGQFPRVWPEESEADRTRNRRVEVMIIRK